MAVAAPQAGPRAARNPGTLADFAKFFGRLVLEDGSKAELEPFQREMLGAYFEGCRETLILIPKKNGKTALLAALGLYHTLTVPDPDVCIVAASRDQAMKLFDAARGFVRRSKLKLHVLRGYREIRLPDPEHPDDSRYFVGLMKVYANDADTFDGWLGTLGLVDELHRHKNEETYGLVRDGLGPRGGQMLTISTAGDNEVSPLGRLRTRAYALPGMRRTDAHRFVRTADFAYHEWALDHDEPSDDLDLVKLANPASWMTVALLRERHDSPSTRTWQFDRFAAGKWSSGEFSAISPREWHACADPEAEIPGGSEQVRIGCDLSQKDDKSAFVPVWIREDGKALVHTPRILSPPGDGTSLLFEDMLEVCREMAERWPGCTFVLDPLAGGEYLAQLIDRELPGVEVATHSQAHGPMCLASERLTTAIAEKRIVHPDDPELNAHVLGAASKAVAEKWRFAKPRGRDVKIDALIALAMAHSTLVADAAEGEHMAGGSH